MLYRLDPDSYKSNEGQIKDAFCHDLTILVRFLKTSLHIAATTYFIFTTNTSILQTFFY